MLCVFFPQVASLTCTFDGKIYLTDGVLCILYRKKQNRGKIVV